MKNVHKCSYLCSVQELCCFVLQDLLNLTDFFISRCCQGHMVSNLNFLFCFAPLFKGKDMKTICKRWPPDFSSCQLDGWIGSWWPWGLYGHTSCMVLICRDVHAGQLYYPPPPPPTTTTHAHFIYTYIFLIGGGGTVPRWPCAVNRALNTIIITLFSPWLITVMLSLIKFKE